jgi:hypothetical protein
MDAEKFDTRCLRFACRYSTSPGRQNETSSKKTAVPDLALTACIFVKQAMLDKILENTGF